MKKIKNKKCCICDTLVKNAYGIYGKFGIKYYCNKKECYERFIEDAGDLPIDYDEII